MWYQGYDGSAWKIGYTQSTDGISWTRNNQPIITPSQVGSSIVGVAEPSVIKINSQYKMWMNGFAGDYKYKIYYAISNDGTHWTVNPSPVLEESLNSWESSGPTNPAVLFENNEYKMWYLAAGNGIPWKVGYATSPDGVTWTRYQNNPITLPAVGFVGFVGGPTVLKLNGTYHMWYHSGSPPNWVNSDIYHVISTDGINWTCDGNCSVLHSGDPFDSQGMTAPFALKNNSKLYLWYGGSNGSRWQINLATYNLPEEPTPTPTPVPSKTPVILIPGFMSSWNKQAIFYQQQVNQPEWKLGSYAREYDGIINTLKNLGYVENQDYFVFAYDWRKGLDSLADDLKNYIQQLSINNQQLNIIGHSMGGLIARIYAQKYGSQNLGKIITVGSPHQGAALTYKSVEAGELDRYNSFLWLGQKILLQLYKDGIKTDKQIINEKIPSVKDFLSTYDFLTNQNNQNVSIQNMQIKNTMLLSYASSFPNLFPFLHTVSGEAGNTISGYKVGPRTTFDTLLDLYPDGRPIETLYQIGDGIVVSGSAKAGNNQSILNLNHGEIIYTKDAVRKILDQLSIPYQNSQIAEGSGTVISPSLLFFILSPAEIEVVYDGQVQPEQNGLIFIPNASSGNYGLNVKGKGKGKYSVLIGEITNDTDSWTTINGEITKTPASSQIDAYTINFDAQNPQPALSSQNAFDELIYYLSDINTSVNIPQITYAINNLRQAKKLFQNNQKAKLKSLLLLTHSYLLVAKNKIGNSLQKNNVMKALDKIENLCQSSVEGYTQGINARSIQKQLANYKNTFLTILNSLLTQKNQGKDISSKMNLVGIINTKLQQAENFYNAQKYIGSEIFLKTVESFIQDIRKP